MSVLLPQSVLGEPGGRRQQVGGEMGKVVGADVHISKLLQLRGQSTLKPDCIFAEMSDM